LILIGGFDTAHAAARWGDYSFEWIELYCTHFIMFWLLIFKKL